MGKNPPPHEKIINMNRIIMVTMITCPTCSGQGQIDKTYKEIRCPECGYPMIWNEERKWYDCANCGVTFARILFGRF